MTTAYSTQTVASLQYLRSEVAAIKEKVDAFVRDDCIPLESEFEHHLSQLHGSERWTLDAIPPCVSRLQERAKELGLWNMFIPPRLIPQIPPNARHLAPSVSLNYREYGILCESLGRSPFLAPQACNSSAPDTGNMEVLLEFGTMEQKQKYLLPLMEGTIRSTFLMTEPDVASSDPTNLKTTLTKLVDRQTGAVEYKLSGSKWWSTGAMDPRCQVAVVVAKMDYSQVVEKPSASLHGAHTIVLVPLPHPGVILERALTTFGYDDAPYGHAQVRLDNVRLTSADLVLGEGSGFRVSQARLGPGRIHHCMRAIGMAARSYEIMLQRAMERKTFGKYLWEHGGCQEMIADSLTDLEAARLLTLACAASMDEIGVKASRNKISMIKVAVPEMTLRVVDRAIQVLGGAGVCADFPLAQFLAGLRTLRIADGPDAVHRRTVAKIEIMQAKKKLKGEIAASRL